MCSETGSRYTGMLLLALAKMAIVANLLLYFPNGQVLEPAKITDLVWSFHGFLGAGLLVRMKLSTLPPPSHKAIISSWAHLPWAPRKWLAMLFPVLLAMQGTMGAMYCVVISSLGLLSGPFCDADGTWNLGNHLYASQRSPLSCGGNYLFNQPTWATCREPEHIVLWNVVLLSILLGIGAVEAVLCLSQLASGLCDIFCGTCIRKARGAWVAQLYNNRVIINDNIIVGV
uniref:Transmembrane 4 L six family member 1 n=1 Tax=Lynx canadensis TaxID=61383 RepID=A0A667HLI0_LYNCA